MISLELRNKVMELIETSISIQDFEDWLVPLLPILLDNPKSENAYFISSVELGLSEITAEIITMEEFLSDLYTMLMEFKAWEVPYSPDIPYITNASSTNQTSQFVQASIANNPGESRQESDILVMNW